MSNLQAKSAVQKRLNLAPIKAVIVNGPDGSPNVPGFSGLIWVALYTASGLSTPTAVRFTRIESSDVGTPVLLGYDDSRTLSIINPDFDGQLATGINPISSNVLADPNVNGNNFLNQYQITTLWSGPVSSASDSMLVTVQPWVYVQDGTLHHFLGGDGTGTASVDLTSYIPGSADMQCLAVLFVDDTDMIEVQTSTPIPQNDPFSDDDVQECITNASDGAKCKPIIAYRLYHGQTTIKPNFFVDGGDVYLDLRNFINICSSGGSGTVTSVGLSTDVSYLTVGSSPITTAGTITLDKTTGLTANQVVATPNGSTGPAELRALVAADIPNLSATKITSGQLAGAQGGLNTDASGFTGMLKEVLGTAFVATPGTDYTSPTGAENLSNKTITASSLVATALSLLIGGFKAIFTHGNTADRTYTLPDKTGTVALTSDVVFRVPVKAATSSNVNIASAPSSVDGQSLSINDRILLFGQTTGSQNGLWVFNGAGSALSRPTDYESGSTTLAFFGVTVECLQGTTRLGNLFYLTTTGVITIDTTSTSWSVYLYDPAQLTTQVPTNKGGTGQNLSASTGSLIVASGTVSANTDTGTGNSVRATSPTITTPTIGDFTNSTHNHQNAAGGGTLDAAAIASGTLSTSRLPHKFAVYEDQKTSGTAGGASTATTWTSRTINTQVVDADGLITLNADNLRMKPIAGTYRVTMWNPVVAASTNTGWASRLFNNTGSSVPTGGQSPNGFGFGNAGAEIISHSVIVTANGTDEYVLQYYVTVGRATNGLGLALSIGGSVEHYGRVMWELIG